MPFVSYSKQDRTCGQRLHHHFKLYLIHQIWKDNHYMRKYAIRHGLPMFHHLGSEFVTSLSTSLYVPCRFKTLAIMSFHSFLSFVLYSSSFSFTHTSCPVMTIFEKRNQECGIWSLEYGIENAESKIYFVL